MALGAIRADGCEAAACEGVVPRMRVRRAGDCVGVPLPGMWTSSLARGGESDGGEDGAVVGAECGADLGGCAREPGGYKDVVDAHAGEVAQPGDVGPG
jgi:hypothetical protein